MKTRCGLTFYRTSQAQVAAGSLEPQKRDARSSGIASGERSRARAAPPATWAARSAREDNDPRDPHEGDPRDPRDPRRPPSRAENAVEGRD